MALRCCVFFYYLVLVLIAFSIVPLARGAVSEAFTYQGSLEQSGEPAQGSFDFIFMLYDMEIGGSSVGNSPIHFPAVNVQDGLFSVKLDFGDGAFEGEQRWLEIHVRVAGGSTYTTLSPRQQIAVTPYAVRALGLVGPQVIESSVGPILAPSEPVGALEVRNTFMADGAPDVSYSILAENSNSIFDSNDSEHSAAIYGRGQGNYVYGVLGEAGDVSDGYLFLGSIGLVARGSGRGAAAWSKYGVGVHGVSDENYGVWGQSSNYRGVTGRTSRPDNNYGLFTADNLYSLNINLTGATMQVMHNGGETDLVPGDVVVFSGLRHDSLLEVPVPDVALAEMPGDPAVAGVVFSRFDITLLEDGDEPASLNQTRGEITPASPAPPGEYLLVVIQGPAKVNLDASGRVIRPGELMTTAGSGMGASLDVVRSRTHYVAARGSVFGKALEHSDGSSAHMYVFVNLN